MRLTGHTKKSRLLAAARGASALLLAVTLTVLPLSNARASADSSEASGYFSVILPGLVDAGQNNVVLGAGGEFALIAPFGDTNWLLPEAGTAAAELTDFQRAEGAGSLLWSINTSTGEKADQAVVGFFPSKIVVDASGTLVAVRHLGSKFDDNGSFVPRASLSILRLGADGHLSLMSENTIPAVGASGGEPADGSAPDDLFLAADGSFAFATNGASIFAYDTATGEIVAHREVLHADQYAADNEITSISYHAGSGTFGVIYGNSIFVNDNGPDSQNIDAAPIKSIDVVSFFQFIPPVAAAAAGAEAVPSRFTEEKLSIFPDWGISAGSNVEFNEDGTAAFVYAARDGYLLGIDVRTGIVRSIVRVDMYARDLDDLKSVRTLVYSAQTKTIAIVVTGKRITHPADYAKKITHPADFARRITHPADFARRITHPADRSERRGVFDDSTVTPRLYLVTDGGLGNLIPSYSYTNFAPGTAISAPSISEHGALGYFASNDGHLFTVDLVNGTFDASAAPRASSAPVAFSGSASKLAIVDSPPASNSEERPTSGSITVVRSVQK